MILNNPYFYITFVGLCVKIWASNKLYKTESKNLSPRYFWLLLVACYCQTLFELGIYSIVETQNQSVINFVLFGYYIATFAALLLLPLSISYLLYQKISSYVIALNIMVFAVLIYYLLFTQYLVLGFEAIPYAITRIPGEYYFAFQAFVVLILLICLFLLINEKHYAETSQNQIKASNILIGFIPISMVIVTVMVLMSIGIEVNMVGPLPLLMAIFIISIAENLNEANITDYRVYLPWTKEAKLVRQISEPFRNLNYADGSYKNRPKLYEQILIQHALKMFPSRKKAAKWLGISESKISRTLKDSEKNE